MNTNKTSIIDYFAGKSIFVTGGTGFVGKVLVEKLLYSCDVDKIYLLIRGKEDATGKQRWQEIVQSPVFDRLRNTKSQVLEKIVTIPGDIQYDNLGINSDDEQSFVNKVSVVFHSAATVKFHERLDIAVNYNYEATKRVISLCRRMKNLQSFVYFSTAFINPLNLYLDEVVYPAPVSDEELKAFIDKKEMDDEEKLTAFLHGRPNTYTFSKALAETYVAENHGNIPTVIIRPSIVTSAAKEPIPGWLNSWSAADAVLATSNLGYNRVVVGKGSNLLDLIPVDYVTNLAIVAAANNQKHLQIFNSCTTACNPISLKDLYRTTRQYTVKHGYNDLPVPFIVATNDGIQKEVAVFFLEKLPAMVADLYRHLMGKKPRYVKLHAKVSSSRELINFFTSRSFVMSADKTIALSRSISKQDAEIFQFNPKELNWRRYLPLYMQGIRKYLLKK